MQHLSEKFSCFFCVYCAHFLLLLFSFHTFIHPLFLSFNRLLFAEYFYMQDAVKYQNERIRSSICSLSYHCSYFFYLSSLSQSFIGLLLFICRYINLYLSSLVLEQRSKEVKEQQKNVCFKKNVRNNLKSALLQK